MSTAPVAGPTATVERPSHGPLVTETPRLTTATYLYPIDPGKLLLSLRILSVTLLLTTGQSPLRAGDDPVLLTDSMRSVGATEMMRRMSILIVPFRVPAELAPGLYVQQLLDTNGRQLGIGKIVIK